MPAQIALLPSAKSIPRRVSSRACAASAPLFLHLARISLPARPLSSAEAFWAPNLRVYPEARREGHAPRLLALKRRRNDTFFRGSKPYQAELQFYSNTNQWMCSTHTIVP
jgi:hypothetical protein